jgi:UDP-glucose 4-epimerase
VDEADMLLVPGASSNRLTGRRVLVTGAAGFIGTALCRRLLQAGAEVHGTWRTRPPEPGSGVVWSRVDLCDSDAAGELVELVRPHVVFHLAGWVTGSRDVSAVVPALNDTLNTAVHVLVSAHRHGCERVLLAGSMEEPEAGASPSSPYAAAKGAERLFANLFAELYRLPVVDLRVFMAYGPGQADLTKLVPYVALSLLRGDSPRLSSGRRRIDWIYIDDVVDGMLAAAQSDLVPGVTIDLGTGTRSSVADVAHTIADIVGSGPPVILGAIPDRPLEAEPVADVDRTRRMTGWAPSVPLRTGLERTVEWCRLQTLSGQVLRDA